MDGTSSYYDRFGKHCTAIHIPFGALFDFMPNAEDMRKPSDAKMPYGILVGYCLDIGGKWSGDYFVFPLVAL